MTDLRGRWVFPRLAYATTTQAIDRNVRRLLRFMIVRPWKRITQLLDTWRSHESKAEVIRAALEASAEVIRALALLVVAIAFLLFAVERL
jgi:hypothetical protein